MTTIANFEISSRFKDIMNDLKTANLRALKDIPIELLAIDITYQTEERTSRDYAISRLASRWDENKLEPITVVPHVEEGKFYVVNGYGRWMASQMQTPKYEYLCANVLLGAMKVSPEERRKFESEIFAYQDREVSQLKPIHIHGALVNLENTEALIIESLREKYRFSFSGAKGQREKGVIGSYSELYKTVKSKGEECLDYIFSVCVGAGFDRKPNGYASYIIRAIKDIWSLYPNDRDITGAHLSQYLRDFEPAGIKAKAQVRYPVLDYKAACSLSIEDEVVTHLALNQCRTFDGGKIIKLA